MIVGRNWTGTKKDIGGGNPTSSPVSAYYHVREVYDITVLLNQPVFDSLQYTKTEGKHRPSPFYHMNHAPFPLMHPSPLPVYCVHREGSLTERTSLRPFLVVSVLTTGVLNVHEMENVLLLVQDGEHMCKMCSFYQGPLSPSVYQGRH